MTGDGRPGREPESASFETARLRPRRGTQPIFIVGFLAVIGGVVAVGLGGRSVAQPTLPPIALDTAAPATIAATVQPSPEPSPEPSPAIFIPHATANAAPVYATGPGQLELRAQRLPASLYVHGDVFVPQVTWVFVSLQDGAGRVAGWASVSVPGAAGPARDKGPTLRFDVEMNVPDGFGAPLWLNANAYDAEGALMTSVRLEIGPATFPRMQFEP